MASKIFPASVKDAEIEIQNVIRSAIDDAIDFVDSEISPHRQVAEIYYRGGTRLKHEKGRSGVVVTKVRDTIQGIIPSIARVFTQSDKVVEFYSDDEEDELMTKDQTIFCQNIYDRHEGYKCLIGATIDAMKARIGVVRVSLIKSEMTTAEQIQTLTPPDAEILAEQDNVVIGSVEETGEELDGLPLAKVSVSRIIRRNKWKLQVMAPESFFIDSSATSTEDARIFGFREMMRKYEAVEMGIPKETVEEIGTSSESGVMESERQARLGYSSSGADDETALDPMADEILVCEGWMRIDTNGDGIPEFWHFITLGDNHTVVYAEQVNYHGIAIFRSDMEPNTFFPKSIAEDLMQDQDAMTALLRSILDNTALVNSPRTEINENQVNMEDAKNNEIGALIRVKSMGQINELVTPFVAGDTLPVLQYLEKVSEARSGLTKWSQGIDPDALQSTTKAASLASIQAGDARVEMIARNIAESGVKEMFFAILRTAMYELNQPQSIKINEQYEEIDPSKWHDKLSVSVNVGLGNGNIETKQQILQTIGQVQQLMVTQFGLSNPISGYTQVRNNLKHQLYLAGIRNINDYFPMVDPQVLQQLDQQMQQSKQQQGGEQAAMAQVQAWAAVEREKAQLKMQADMQKMQQEFQLRMQEMAQQAKEQMAQLMAKVRVDLEKEYLKDDRERDAKRMDYETDAFKIGLDNASRMKVEQDIARDRGYGTNGSTKVSQTPATQGTNVKPIIQ